jgi:PAS domain-containing protein
MIVYSAIAVFCLAAGAIAMWLFLSKRRETASVSAIPDDVSQSDSSSRPTLPEADGVRVRADTLPFTASVDVLARDLGVLLGDRAELTLLAIYGGRSADDDFRALVRAPVGREIDLPPSIPGKILSQLGDPKLVDHHELASGLRPGLPGLPPSVEAAVRDAERHAGAEQPVSPVPENPFAIDEEVVDPSVSVQRERARKEKKVNHPPPDPATIAARIAALPWRGPFGWSGIIVARPAGDDAGRSFRRLEGAIEEIGARLAVLCEMTRLSRNDPPPATAPPPLPAATAPPQSPVTPALALAERKVAELFLAARTGTDVLRAVLVVLSEGLRADRCYVVEVSGLRPSPVELERRRADVASAVGLDLGQEFLDAVRARAREGVGPARVDARNAAPLLPEHARAQLTLASQLAVPVFEKGRIVSVFVVDRIHSKDSWSDEEEAFADRVVARAATAHENLARLDSLAQQVAHAREEQEQISDAFEQLQAVVGALPDAMIGVDVDGRITYANRAAARFFRRPEFELIGSWLAEVSAEFEGIAWERALAAETSARYPVSFSKGPSTGSFEVVVAPGVGSPVFTRLIALREHR